MKVICFECGEQIGEKAPFSDNEASHALCESCLRRTLRKLKNERRLREQHLQRSDPDVTVTSKQ